MCRQLCDQSGSVVASVDYRLAPEAPFPAAVEDAYAAFEWIHSEADALVGSQAESNGGSGTVSIVVCGDSAGAELAALVAIMCAEDATPLAGQILVYPGTDYRDPSIYPSQTEFASGYVLTRESLDWFDEVYANDPLDWRTSILLAELSPDLAPALVVTAGCDPLRDEGEAYARLLEEAAVPVTLTRYEGMVHLFFQLGPMSGQARTAVSQVAKAASDFFR